MQDKKVYIFDFDNTVILGEGQLKLVIYLFKKRKITLLYLIKVVLWFVLYRLGIAGNPRGIMEYAFRYVIDKTEEEIDNELEPFMDELVSRHLYRPVFDEMMDASSGGNVVLLASNSASPIIKNFAKRFGITNYFATKLEIKDGRYTGRIDGNIMYGDEKLKSVQSFIAGSYSVAYSDNQSDIPLLSAVNEAVAVHAVGKLKTLASKNKWRML